MTARQKRALAGLNDELGGLIRRLQTFTMLLADDEDRTAVKTIVGQMTHSHTELKEITQ